MPSFSLLSQQASTEERILAAVSTHDPRQSGHRVAFQCPSCGARGRTAYAYLNNASGHWRCNRVNECGAEGHLWDGLSAAPPPKRKAPAPALDPRKYGRIVRAGRGRLSSRAWAYLTARLPGFDPAGLEDFAKQIDVYDLNRLAAKDLAAAGAKRLLRDGYELVLGLRALDSGAVVSLQGRAVGPLPSKASKILSSKGGYGGAGACFGSLEEALEEAESLGRLIVVEGLVDFLTARAAGVRGLVGVPGVGLAKRLAKELVSRAWLGRLLVSLDGDDAGAAGLEDIAKALKGSLVEMATGRPRSGDINDIWRAAAERGESGAAAVRAHFEAALARMEFKPLQALPRVRLSKTGKSRARALYYRNQFEQHSSLRSLGTTGVCGALNYQRRRLSRRNQIVGQIKRSGVPVCERQTCPFCRGQSWAQYVCHGEQHWPEQMALLKIEISDRRALERLRAKLSKLGRAATKEEGSGYLTAVDAAKGVLVVLATFDVARAMAAKVGEFESVSRSQALCELAPCFIGSAVRAAEKLNDGTERLDDIESDEWINKSLRWASTSGEALSLPEGKDVRDAVRAEARRRGRARARAKVGAAERIEDEIDDPIDAQGLDLAPHGSVDVHCYWDGVELVALSLTPLSVTARLAVLERRPIDGLDPADPGNLLDNPDIAGPAVGDWVRRFYRHHAEKELEPRGRGEDRPPRAGLWDLRRPLEALLAIVDAG